MCPQPDSEHLESILVVDIGSSWCKAAYIDRNGRFLGQAKVAAGLEDLAPNQILAAHWRVVVEAVRLATEDGRANGELDRGPAAINFSCRGLLGIAIDHSGQSILLMDDANVISRYRETSSLDNSAGELEDALIEFGYGSRQGALMGWLAANDPDRWRTIEKAGGLRDWVAYRLTGVWATDHTIGPGQATWPPSVIAESKLPPIAFAQILGPAEFAGRLLPETAAELGLPAGVPVASGLHDGAAANIGVGAIKPGDVCLTLGTNFSLRAVTGPRLERAFCYVIVPGRWAWVDNATNAAVRLDIAARLLSLPGEALVSAHQRLGQQALTTVRPGCDGFSFPVLGRRDLAGFTRELHAALVRDLPAPLIYRAVTEQVGYEVRWLLERARRAGARPETFIATGGALNNQLVTRVLTASLAKPIYRGEQEAGLIGAALAAGTGLGWYPSLDEAVERNVRVGRAIEPDPAEVQFYEAGWQQWRARNTGMES